jgi:ATP-dependent DNA helicase RecQ
MIFRPDRALKLLRTGISNPEVDFREGQAEAIRHVVEGRGRLLVVQKTGWGKSFVYFIALKLMREEGAGPALLISPLLALMRNQIAAAERMGVRAVTINSENADDWSEIEQKVETDEVDILLVSPERLANQRFRDRVLALMGDRVSLLIIDEAHCISDWGHDFRPEYRLVERTIGFLPANLRVLATTATANDRVIDDLHEVLGPDLDILRGELSRMSLRLQTIRLASQAERLAWLAEQVPRLVGSGIIYTLTKRDAGMVAEWLRSRGLDVHAYTSETASDAKLELEDALLGNRVKALVATTALGMGYDKPDLHFVIHYQTPGSAVAYYQQVGRAGRALDAAYGVLLSGEEEAEITDYFIDSAFPTREEVSAILHALEAAPNGLSIPELLARVNVGQRRIEGTMKLLALESAGPLVKVGSKWQLTASDLSEEFWTRAERLTDLRHREQQEMREYVGLATGHMEFLLRVLDGDVESVIVPPIPPLPTTVDTALVREAEDYLRRTSIVVEPRRQWPAGGLPKYGVRGRIRLELQASPGRALCMWRDAGWGGLVRAGKYEHGHFPNELVDACRKLIEVWTPDPTPTWVTSIPSPRHPGLVPDFARRLATALGLPYGDVLEWRENRPEQKTRANSAQQARNIDGALRLSGPVDPGPVLLIDDMVDSRWTLTVAAWLLRSEGTEAVFPLALSQV